MALKCTIEQTRSNLATLAKSADRAATELVSGGNLLVAGRQPDFIAEACGRAGGLMAIAPEISDPRRITMSFSTLSRVLPILVT